MAANPHSQTSTDLQSLCEVGQQQLMLMDYLAAESTLVRAEQTALSLDDFETLSRLYMPLQETRRQRRQICGEGTVHLRLLANFADDPAINAARLIKQYPHGQLLIAGWGSVRPAHDFRALQMERGLYVDTFVAAVYPSPSPGADRLIAIVPFDNSTMPAPIPRSIEELVSLLPPDAILLRENELPAPRTGDTQTYAWTMALWERLHAPFLAAADNQNDLLQKMEGYREAIAVDYACELAHQKLSAAARNFARLGPDNAAIDATSGDRL